MADVEVAVGVRGAIVKYEPVIGGSVRLLPLVVVVGRSLDILLLKLGQRSRSKQAKKFSQNGRGKLFTKGRVRKGGLWQPQGCRPFL